MVLIRLAAFLCLVSSSLAAHSSNANSHARRSLSNVRRDGNGIFPIDLNIPGVTSPGGGDPAPDGGDPNGDPNGSSTTSTSSSSSSTSSTSDATSTTTTSTSSTSSTSSVSSTSSISSTSSTSSSSTSSAAVTPPPSSTSGSTSVLPASSVTDSTSPGLCILGILGPGCGPSSTPSDTPSSTPSSTPTDTPTDTPTSTPTDSVTTPPPSSSPTDSSSPTSSPTSSSSSPDLCLLGILGPGCTTSTTPTDTPSSTPTDTPTDTPTNTPTDTPTGSPTDTITTPPPSSSPTDSSSGPTSSPSSSPDLCLLGLLGPGCTSPTSTPSSTPTGSPTDTPTDTPTGSPTDTITTPPPSSSPTDTASGPTTSQSSTDDPCLLGIIGPGCSQSSPTSGSDGPTSAPPTTDQPPPTSGSTPPTTISSPTTDVGPTSVVTSGSDGPTTTPSSTPVISFPSGNATASGTITDSGVTTSTSSGDPIITTITSISVDPALSFVLTESSLAVASIPSTASTMTLTDPDQATSSFSSPSGTAAIAATALNTPPLPTGIPGRILPADQLGPNTDLGGYTLISILFNQELNWPFVVNSPISSSQIFAYLPVLIQAALGITGDQVKTFALQVYVPTDYSGPSDANQLGTLYLGYIPSDMVNELAAEIKVKTSAFYTGVSDTVAQGLAQRVNSGFSIRSVSSSAGVGSADPGSSGSLGGAVSATSGNSSRSRQDAIIGVVSALGAIALLVLVFLVYRSMKRRRQLAHHRLSDPPDMVGIRPEGREFDQDSVGGARRRSFYFAEDSLRGFQSERPDPDLIQFDGPMAVGQPGQVMSQRRNVVPGAISAPILRESSMNW